MSVQTTSVATILSSNNNSHGEHNNPCRGHCRYSRSNNGYGRACARESLLLSGHVRVIRMNVGFMRRGLDDGTGTCDYRTDYDKRKNYNI